MDPETQAALDAVAAAAGDFESTAGAVTTLAQPWTADLVQFLSVSILIFSCIVLLMVTALLWRRAPTAVDILRVFGIIAIIGVSAMLLVAGYSNDQLTPIIGLFGAIAGYLLGKESASKKGENQ